MLVACFIVVGCAQQPELSVTRYLPQDGDVIFQSLPHNPLIDAIEGSTGSPYSHCGILRKNGSDWFVLEAIGPVTETRLSEWIGRGREQRYTVYRLKDSYRAKIPSFISAAQGYAGRPYDIHYDLDDGKIYCSELIFKAFRSATGEEMGKIQRLGELDWQPHAAVIRQIEGGNIPLERKMITPRSLSEASQLERVYGQ